MIKKQFTIYLKNRCGELAGVTRKLAMRKVNIEGISVAESTDAAMIQIVVSNSDITKQILRQAGIPFTVQDVVLLSLQNEPGALSLIVERLAMANLNINYVYCTACRSAGRADCFAVISAPDLKKVEKLWKALTKAA